MQMQKDSSVGVRPSTLPINIGSNDGQQGSGISFERTATSPAGLSGSIHQAPRWPWPPYTQVESPAAVNGSYGLPPASFTLMSPASTPTLPLPSMRNLTSNPAAQVHNPRDNNVAPQPSPLHMQLPYTSQINSNNSNNVFPYGAQNQGYPGYPHLADHPRAIEQPLSSPTGSDSRPGSAPGKYFSYGQGYDSSSPPTSAGLDLANMHSLSLASPWSMFHNTNNNNMYNDAVATGAKQGQGQGTISMNVFAPFPKDNESVDQESRSPSPLEDEDDDWRDSPTPPPPHQMISPPGDAQLLNIVVDGITYTTDADVKQNALVKRRCFNCDQKDSPSWRKSREHPGRILCNRCGLYESQYGHDRPLDLEKHRRMSKMPTLYRKEVQGTSSKKTESTRPSSAQSINTDFRSKVTSPTFSPRPIAPAPLSSSYPSAPSPLKALEHRDKSTKRHSAEARPFSPSPSSQYFGLNHGIPTTTSPYAHAYVERRSVTSPQLGNHILPTPKSPPSSWNRDNEKLVHRHSKSRSRLSISSGSGSNSGL
nr:uncharacterized protein CI109_006572 [Kwoniella shandongensis]KAA5525110.1 hypothetical protein CI109_006572 [Kwoniella shandongensis]